jgi:hypothetical protein
MALALAVVVLLIECLSRNENLPFNRFASRQRIVQRESAILRGERAPSPSAILALLSPSALWGQSARLADADRGSWPFAIEHRLAIQPHGFGGIAPSQ